MSNAPDRFALFILSEGEARTTVHEEQRVSNAVTVTLHKEDHTMANLLRNAVIAQPGVRFSGYRVPHPLEPRAELRIQTDGKNTPIQTLHAACQNVIADIAKVQVAWKTEVQMYGAETDEGQAGGMGGVIPLGAGAMDTGAGADGYVDM